MKKSMIILSAVVAMCGAAYASDGVEFGDLAVKAGDLKVAAAAESNTIESVIPGVQAHKGTSELDVVPVCGSFKECRNQMDALSAEMDNVTDPVKASAIVNKIRAIDNRIQELYHNLYAHNYPPYNPDPKTVQECAEQIALLSAQLDMETDPVKAGAIVTEMREISHRMMGLLSFPLKTGRG